MENNSSTIKKEITKMKTLKVVTFLLLALFVFAGQVDANHLHAQYKCQYDKTTLYMTGKTKVEWGKLVYLYKCAAGHRYWIAK